MALMGFAASHCLYRHFLPTLAGGYERHTVDFSRDPGIFFRETKDIFFLYVPIHI